MTTIRFILFITTIFLLPVGIVYGQSLGLSGTVLDSESGVPVAFAYIHLEELNRTTTTNLEGRFRLSNVQPGTYTLSVHRIGYLTQNRLISVQQNDNDSLVIEISPTVLSGQAVEIIGDAEETIGANLEHASIRITGDQLRRNLGATLSETLNNQPGFDQRTMGAAPGRPVIRGLGDERVLILQDGVQTGDVSWTSSDHSVTVDPASANEIEVARGPAALIYGSNAIGGVINVVRNLIPNSIPTDFTGSTTLNGVSVNRGITAGTSLTFPVNSFAMNVDLNGRSGEDYKTPIGTFTNTYHRSTNNALGISYIRPWGYTGASGTMYLSEYGIPPDPNGGHEEGVDIEVAKYQVEGKAEILIGRSIFNLLEIQGSFTSYEHKEIESDGIIGTRLAMITHSLSATMNHSDIGIFNRGVVGLDAETIDYAAFGSRTPHSNSYSFSLFAVQEADFESLHLETGFRVDYNLARPKTDRPDSFIGNIRERSFLALATSLSAILDIGEGFHIGTTVLHSFRPPSLEELYSEGPHLAAYSYEIGNPGLNSERGLGSELFIRHQSNRINSGLTIYYNLFSNYIHSQDTGRPNFRFPGLNDWQFVGTGASMYGIELSSELQAHDNIVLDGNFSMTVGNRKVTDEEKMMTGLTESRQPLPMIPPAKGAVGIRYVKSDYLIGAQFRLSASQERTGEFEAPTDGYWVLDLNTQYRFDWGNTFHSITLNLLNVFDTEYYNHLSRIKDLFPEPGRSVNFLYRIYF